MKARIHVTLKEGILDPQGHAITNALNNLGYSNVTNVRQGKYVEIDLNEKSMDKARKDVEKMCADFLANANTEDFTVVIAEQ